MAENSFVNDIIKGLSGDGGLYELLFRVLGTLDALDFRIVNNLADSESDNNHLIDLRNLVGREVYMHFVIEDGKPQYEVIYRDKYPTQQEIRLGTVRTLPSDFLSFFHEVFEDKEFTVVLTHFKDEVSRYFFDSSLTQESKRLCYQYVWRYGERTIPVKNKSVEGFIKYFTPLIDKAENNGDLDSLNNYKETIGNFIIESQEKDKSLIVELFSKVGKARENVLERKSAAANNKSKSRNGNSGSYFDTDEFREGIDKLTKYIRHEKYTKWAHVYYFLKPHGLGKMSKSRFGKFIQEHGGPSYKTVSNSGNYELKGEKLTNELGTINSIKMFFPNIE